MHNNYFFVTSLKVKSLIIKYQRSFVQPKVFEALMLET